MQKVVKIMSKQACYIRKKEIFNTLISVKLSSVIRNWRTCTELQYRQHMTTQLLLHIKHRCHVGNWEVDVHSPLSPDQ